MINRNILYTEVLTLWWDEYKNTILDTTQHKKSEEMRVHIVPCFKNVKVKSITTELIQAFVDEKQVYGSKTYQKGLSPWTIKGLVNIIRQSLNWAVNNKYAKNNVAKGVKLPKISQKEIKTFSLEEMQKLIIAARPKWMGDIISIAFRTGMRRGEIYGLQWDDIDFENQFLMVRRTISATKPNEKLIHQPKTTKSSRRISLDTASLEILTRRKATSKSEWVFVNQFGEPLSPWYNTKYMAKACKDANIPHRCFHTLRHTHATVLLSKGVNPKIVQERLGHSKIEMTLGTYSHVLPTMQEVAVDIFNKI